jgi:LPPG:FO 2-phospho-L-lactate transferase
MSAGDQILALAGGVGGARLAHGLAMILAAENLAIAVNTADDFEHLGLYVSPDLDTVMYTLAEINNPETGWGVAGESWNFMAALGALGGETWFSLGDRDLATHVERTRRLRAGDSLSDITENLCSKLGIACAVMPMTDGRVRTVVETAGGEKLAFQDYFVRLACAPEVAGFSFDGAESAEPAPALGAMLQSGGLGAVIICPSNPYVSIAPMLAIPELARFIATRRVPVAAVSPIVGGAAIKGPAAKMMAELGVEISPLGIARHYGGRIDGMVIDQADRALSGAIEDLGIKVLVTDTVMRDTSDKSRLAQQTVAFARALEVTA